MARNCSTCRWWDVHSIEARRGDCRAPDNHRYWRGTFGPHQGVKVPFLMDSFGKEETLPSQSCNAWQGSEPVSSLTSLSTENGGTDGR